MYFVRLLKTVEPFFCSVLYKRTQCLYVHLLFSLLHVYKHILVIRISYLHKVTCEMCPTFKITISCAANNAHGFDVSIGGLLKEASLNRQGNISLPSSCRWHNFYFLNIFKVIQRNWKIKYLSEPTMIFKADSSECWRKKFLDWLLIDIEEKGNNGCVGQKKTCHNTNLLQEQWRVIPGLYHFRSLHSQHRPEIQC